MSFIAAFPAVYRDSLANGKRHNGVHEWNKESTKGGGGRYRQASPACIVARNVVRGRRERSDKETRVRAAYKGVEGLGWTTSARESRL